MITKQLNFTLVQIETFADDKYNEHHSLKCWKLLFNGNSVVEKWRNSWPLVFSSISENKKIQVGNIFVLTNDGGKYSQIERRQV